MWRLIIVLVAALALGGCGANSPDEDGTDAVDLTGLVTILPTQPGLDQASSRIRSVDASTLEGIFARREGTASKGFEEAGFREAVVRTWTGPDGGAMLVAVSRWPDHQVATSIGGAAAVQPLDSLHAKAWNPQEINGARGARIDAPGAASRVLAIAIGNISLVVRADGPVTDAAVVRTLDLVSRPPRAASQRA
jgi:hypothetical protein